MEHEIRIGLDTDSKEKALEVAEALVTIRNILGDNDTIELAKVIKAKPGLIKTVKRLFA
jgi:hypothetical protein